MRLTLCLVLTVFAFSSEQTFGEGQSHSQRFRPHRFPKNFGHRYPRTPQISPPAFNTETTTAAPADTNPRTLIPRRVYNRYKHHERGYNRFLNYGRRKTKPGRELENEILKSKVNVLGEILKVHVQSLREVRKLTLKFLVTIINSLLGLFKNGSFEPFPFWKNVTYF